MRLLRILRLSLATGIAVLSAAVLLGLSGLASPALAQELAVETTGRESPALSAQAPADKITFSVVFTDPASVAIFDLSGNALGEGTHVGAVRCHAGNCNMKTRLQLTNPPSAEYEYRFTSQLALDPGFERALVAGVGTLTSGNQKERFSFTATFQNNRDGTVSVTYAASRPDASFAIPAAPGTFAISSRP